MGKALRLFYVYLRDSFIASREKMYGDKRQVPRRDLFIHQCHKDTDCFLMQYMLDALYVLGMEPNSKISYKLGLDGRPMRR